MPGQAANYLLDRVRREFSEAGFDLTVSRVDRFNCYQARWEEPGVPSSGGSVVGHSEAAAAVYALAQLRRQLVATATA